MASIKEIDKVIVHLDNKKINELKQLYFSRNPFKMFSTLDASARALVRARKNYNNELSTEAAQNVMDAYDKFQESLNKTFESLEKEKQALKDFWDKEVVKNMDYKLSVLWNLITTKKTETPTEVKNETVKETIIPKANADDSWIELWDITPDPKKEAMLVQKDTQPNQLKAEKLKIRDWEAYQDRQVVKNPDWTFKYLSHQTWDYKDTDEVTWEKLTTLDQVKKQIDKWITQDYAYKVKIAKSDEDKKKQIEDAKKRGYSEENIYDISL